MKIWKVDCGFSWEEDKNGCSSYSFGSYDGALMWVINHADELDWVSIADNNYMPCDEDNPEGQLYIGCDVSQYYERKDIEQMKYIYTDICPKM